MGLSVPEGMHPLVWLGARLGVAFALLPLVRALALATMGRSRRDALASTRPREHALATALPVALAGAWLGWDALDPGLVGAAVATHAAARMAAALVFVGLAVFPTLPALKGARRGPEGASEGAGETWTAIATLAVTALVPWLALAALRMTTPLADDPLSPAMLAKAPLRAALVPTDGLAHTALAYRAAGSNLDRARRELGLAVALAAPRARTLEVDAELRARMGDCRGAELAFRASLEANVPESVDELLRTPLSLHGFHLPPSLVTRCGYGSGPR